jgi:propionyl-CoA synthetase
MPMIPEAVFGMLACSRLGALHSVVFGGFAAPELANRIIDCKPKLILTASAGIEPGNKIIDYKIILDEAL